MNIRLAVIEDAETLAILNRDVQKLHADALPHLFKQPSDEAFSPSAAVELLKDPNNYVYIGEVAGKAIGYIYAEVQNFPGNAFRHESIRIIIHHISIKPEHQKEGYGEQLMQTIIMLAEEKGITTILLDVWSFNTSAQSFFTRQGFTTFNERMWLQTHT